MEVILSKVASSYLGAAEKTTKPPCPVCKTCPVCQTCGKGQTVSVMTIIMALVSITVLLVNVVRIFTKTHTACTVARKVWHTICAIFLGVWYLLYSVVVHGCDTITPACK